MKYIKTLDGAIALLLTIVFIALFFLLTSCNPARKMNSCPPPTSKAGKIHQKLPQPKPVFVSRKTGRP
jgi:hypothetical protein